MLKLHKLRELIKIDFIDSNINLLINFDKFNNYNLRDFCETIEISNKIISIK